MALIIEGCDLSGKTTLAKALDWPIMDYDRAIGEESIEVCMKLTSGFIIWDRWWPSEYVYGSLFRNIDNREPYSDISVAQMWQFKMLAEVKGAVMLWLCPSSEELRNRYNVRGDVHHTLDEIYKVNEAYISLISTKQDYLPEIFQSELLQKALLYHTKLQVLTEMYNTFKVNGWGCLQKPKVLFVGEQINKNKPDSTYPFQGKSGCGVYLFECLCAIEFLKPSQVHIINIINKDDSIGIYEGLIKWLQPKTIIALGGFASDNLNQKNIEHTYIQHPAHYKRFHPDKQLKYIDSIKKVLS